MRDITPTTSYLAGTNSMRSRTMCPLTSGITQDPPSKGRSTSNSPLVDSFPRGLVDAFPFKDNTRVGRSYFSTIAPIEN